MPPLDDDDDDEDDDDDDDALFLLDDLSLDFCVFFERFFSLFDDDDDDDDEDDDDGFVAGSAVASEAFRLRFLTLRAASLNASDHQLLVSAVTDDAPMPPLSLFIFVLMHSVMPLPSRPMPCPSASSVAPRARA